MSNFKTKILVGSFFVLLVFINLPYIITFSHGFSTNSNDWSNYSIYISGLINPIISLIGIYLIFIEYTKSINNRNEDKVLKRLEFVEKDLTKILQQSIKYTTVVKKESNATLLQFLRYDKKQEFESIKTQRGGLFVSSDLSFDIVKIICFLNLLFQEINKLDESFQNYYDLKYYDLFEDLFSGFFYFEKIRKRKKIEKNKTYQKSVQLLKNRWDILKKKYLTTASS